MNCKDYILLMSGHIDGLNTQKEEKTLKAHLDSCPQCRKMLEDMKANDAILYSDPLTPPDSIRKNVMSAVRKDAKQKKNRIRNYIVSIAAVAAVLCLVLVASLRLPEKADASNTPAPASLEESYLLEDHEEADIPVVAGYDSEEAQSNAPEKRSAPRGASEVYYHCVFVELPSMNDVPGDLPALPLEDFYSQIPREAQDFYYYGGSIIYDEAIMTYEEMMEWEDKISFRFLQEHVETDTYVVVFCSESR